MLENKSDLGTATNAASISGPQNTWSDQNLTGFGMQDASKKHESHAQFHTISVNKIEILPPELRCVRIAQRKIRTLTISNRDQPSISSNSSVTSSNFTDYSWKSTQPSTLSSIQPEGDSKIAANIGTRTYAVCTACLNFDIFSQYVLFASRQTPLPMCAALHVIRMGCHCTKGVGTK